MLGAGLLVGAGLAEIALRIYVRVGGRAGERFGDFSPLGLKVEPFGTLGYKQVPHAVLKYDNGTAAHADSLGFRGPETTVAKPPGVTRVVMLGGSTTHGWGVNDDETIDAHMRRQLAQRGITNIEVINAGLDGYDARQILERVQHDVLRLSPDVLIINTGINDVRNARFANLVEDDPRTQIWKEPMDRVRYQRVHGVALKDRLKHNILLLRLPGYVLQQSLQNANRDTTDIIANPMAAEFFDRNVRRIAEIAAEHNIKLILSTPPSSLRIRYAANAPPEKYYWLKDAETTQQYRDSLAARLSRLATELTAKGRTVPYLRVQVPKEHFLDDAHLTSEGNAAVAAVFTETVLKVLGR